MGKHTAIAWTDHTFNPWWGCEKVSPGCAHCYAEAFASRLDRPVWGADAPRLFFGDKHWMQPLRWNRAAACVPVDAAHPFDIISRPPRRRVFCSSMADVFEDRRDLDEPRARLWRMIEETPNLDWLLLTKRPEAISSLLPSAWLAQPRENVWLGTSVEDQAAADLRVPIMLSIPARVRFLSCEPLLGPVDLSGALERVVVAEYLRDAAWGVDWVIAGGESGPKARPCDVAWIRSLRDQCGDAGVAFFCKQLGSVAVESPYIIDAPVGSFVTLADGAVALRRKLRDAKGADPSEWPEDLRVQEFPT